MRYAERARIVVERLEAHYGPVVMTGRFDPMDELISCILSQHTSDKNSFPAFDRLKVAYPTWEKMLAAPQADIALVIQSAGLANQKSKAIQAALRQIHVQTGGFTIDFLGEMPLEKALEWLEALPSVGPKTSAIVMNFAFDKPAIPVDTHVYRVGQRLGFIPKKLDANKAHPYVRKRIPADLAHAFHMQLIQLGRDTCRAPKPKCADCPVKDLCPSNR